MKCPSCQSTDLFRIACWEIQTFDGFVCGEFEDINEEKNQESLKWAVVPGAETTCIDCGHQSEIEAFSPKNLLIEKIPEGNMVDLMDSADQIMSERNRATVQTILTENGLKREFTAEKSTVRFTNWDFTEKGELHTRITLKKALPDVTFYFKGVNSSKKI